MQSPVVLTIALAVVAALLAALSAALVLLLLKTRRQDENALFQRLQATVQAQLDGVKEQVSSGLGSVQRSVDTQVNLLGNVQRGLGDLSRTAQQIQSLGQNIAGLEDLLRPPKFRGEMGELLLERLLDQVIPRGHYRMQHRFADGKTVDAAVFLQKRSAPIDSKFPLESFNRVLAAGDQEEARRRRREFDRAVRSHIDAVAEYIRPAEGTLDFSLMYIPAENVFYEVVIRRGQGDFDLCGYALSRKVVPVSPNTLYLYLQSVALGLTGLELQERAQEVWGLLSALERDLDDLANGDFRVLGQHLKNAGDKYADARRKLEVFERRLAVARGLPGSAGQDGSAPREALDSAPGADAGYNASEHREKGAT